MKPVLPATGSLSVHRIRLFCLLLGFVAAALTGIVMNSLLPQASQISIQGDRLIQMEQSIEVLDHGGPPLLGGKLSSVGGLAGAKAGGLGALRGTGYAIGVGDDQGMYLYVPILAHYLDIANPLVALRDMYLALAILAAFLYPMLFFEISGSLLVATIAPGGLVLVLDRGVSLVDVYWAPALIVLIGLPLLLTLRTLSQRAVVVGLVGVCALASISRLHSC